MFRFFKVFVAILAFSLTSSISPRDGNLDEPQVTPVYDNQILFRERGVVVNRATFLHVRFMVNMSDVLDAIDQVIVKLTSIIEIEQKTSGQSIKSFLNGDPDFGGGTAFSDTNELFRNRALDGVAICTLLLDMFQHHASRLRGILEVTPGNYTIHQDKMAHKISKRALGAILGGVALGISLRNVYKIHIIETELANFSSKYNQLIDGITLLNKKHMSVAADVLLLKKLLLLLGHRNYHKIITMVMVLTDRLKDSIDNVHSIISAGQQRRISSRLVYGSDLKDLFKIAQTKAEENDCKMIIEFPSDIYELESTYGYEEDGKVFAIYLHIPFIRRDNELKLREYVPFPLKQSLGMNATIMPKVGNDKYLATYPIRIDSAPKGTTAPHKYRVFGSNELDSCFRLRRTYICGGRNTLRTDIENSCLGSLWQRDSQAIQDNCGVDVKVKREFVAKLSVNEWMVMVPESFSTVIYCGKNYQKNVRIETQSRIKLPEDCQLSLKTFDLTTDVNIEVDFRTSVHTWKFDGNIFDEFIQNKAELSDIINELLATKSELGIKDLTHLKFHYNYSSDQLSKIWEYLSSLNFFSFFGNSSLIIAIVVVFLLVYFGFKRGWFAKCFEWFCDKQAVERLQQRDERPIFWPTVQLSNPRQVIRLHEENPRPTPPPYASVATAPATCNIIDLEAGPDTTLPLDNKYRLDPIPESREVYLEDETSFEQCNPGPIAREGLKLRDFVCNHHAPRGKGHCMGYFRSPP